MRFSDKFKIDAMKISLLTSFILITSFVFFACRKQDDVYREFLKGGEITYAHKADSARVHPGNNRVQISWLRGPDADVSRAKVYWNSRMDSVEIPIPEGNPLDTVRVLLTDMREGIYSFEVITFDINGNHSVTVDLLGEVCGEIYQSSLRARTLVDIFYEDNVYLVWGEKTDDLIGQEVYYQNDEGTEVRHFALVEQDSLLLSSYQLGTPIRYRSLFRPDSLAIDTFYTEFEEEVIMNENFE